MKKPTTVSNTIVAKCDDGAFRKIMLIEANDNHNAMAKYGQTLVYGHFSANESPSFVRI